MSRRHWTTLFVLGATLLLATAGRGAVQVLPAQQLIIITDVGNTASSGSVEFRRILVGKYGYGEHEVILEEISTSAIISELFRVREFVGSRDEVILYWKLPVRRDQTYNREADDLGFFIGNELPNLLRKMSQGPKLVILDSCDMEGWERHRQTSKYANQAPSFNLGGSELIVNVCSDRNPVPPLHALTDRLSSRTTPFNVLDLFEPLLEMNPPAIIVGDLPSHTNALVLRPSGENTSARLMSIIKGAGSVSAKKGAMDELVASAGTAEQTRNAVVLLSEVVIDEREVAEVRQHAIGRLGKIGFSETPEPLKRFLMTTPDGGDENVRIAAVKLVQDTRPRDALEIFETMALKQKPPAAATAAAAIRSLPGDEPVRVLVAILESDRDEDIHVGALDSISVPVVQNPALLAAVLRRVKDKDDDVRAAAVAALSSFVDPAAQSAIVEAVADSDTTVRYQAAFALARIERAKPGQPGIAQAIDRLSRDTNARVREASILGLASLPNRRGATRVAEMISDKDENVRIAAVSSAMELKVADLAPRIRPLLRDESAIVRGVAAESLGLLNDRESLPTLEIMARDEPDVHSRRLATTAVNNLRDTCTSVTSPILLDATARSAERARAISGICAFDHARAMTLLVRLLNDANADVRAASADVLAKVPARTLRPSAEDVFAHGTTGERIGMARALGQANDGFATELLSKIDKQKIDVQFAMVSAMGQRTDDRAAEVLKDWARNRQEDSMQLAVAKSLRVRSEKLFTEAKYRQALDAALTALDIRRQRKDSAQDSEIATDLNNVGVIYLAMKDLEQASNYLNQARARRESLSARDPDLAVTWLNLAAVANERKDTKGAEAAFLRALSVRESTLAPLRSADRRLIRSADRLL